MAMNMIIVEDSSWPDDGLCYYFGNPDINDKVCSDTYKFHKNEYLDGGYFHIADFYATVNRSTISYNQPLSLININEAISDTSDSSWSHSYPYLLSSGTDTWYVQEILPTVTFADFQTGII